MSLQKKNVIQEFVKEEFVPSTEQFLVKYVAGKGNNLHEVLQVDGNSLLVSMPKKYRHTIWLKRDDCLVIDPIEEGKKVRGEIVCLLRCNTVRDLISSRQWPTGDSGGCSDPESLLQFFSSSRKPNREEFDAFPPSESSDMETDEDDGEEENDDENSASANDTNEEAEDDEEKVDNGGDREKIGSSNTSENLDDVLRDRNRSRVQLVTSGTVTVTNVLTDGIPNEIQSLEFGADEEESSDELPRELQRHANTIRIQVNYNDIHKGNQNANDNVN